MFKKWRGPDLHSPLGYVTGLFRALNTNFFGKCSENKFSVNFFFFFCHVPPSKKT